MNWIFENRRVNSCHYTRHYTKVLMLGFMNEEAYKTVETGKVTFFSRTRTVFGLKGERERELLANNLYQNRHDNDTLLIRSVTRSCLPYRYGYLLGRRNKQDIMFLKNYKTLLVKRHEEMPEGSYTTSLLPIGRKTKWHKK